MWTMAFGWRETADGLCIEAVFEAAADEPAADGLQRYDALPALLEALCRQADDGRPASISREVLSALRDELRRGQQARRQLDSLRDHLGAAAALLWPQTPRDTLPF